MSERAKKELDRVMEEMRLEAQSRLPEEDRSAGPGKRLCLAKDDGYSCSKELGHAKPEHVAHGMLGDVAHRWTRKEKRMGYKFMNNGGINWSWLVCYKEVQDGVEIVFIDRWHNGDAWPEWVSLAFDLASGKGSCQFGEAEGRKLIRLEVDDYDLVPNRKGGDTYNWKGRKLLLVTNPAYLFSYGAGIRGPEVKEYLEGPEFARDLLYDAIGHLSDLFNRNEFTQWDQEACDLMGRIHEELGKEKE